MKLFSTRRTMTKKIEFRTVQKSDNATLAKIIRAIFHEFGATKQGTVYSDPTTDDLTSLFSTVKSELLGALLDGSVVGCGGIYPSEGLPTGCVEFVKYYLQSEARGLGIGRLLIHKSIKAVRTYGYQSVYIESLPHFKKALSIYESLGFTYLEKPLGNSSHTACDVWMHLPLK